MGTVTSSPVLRVRVDGKCPFKNVKHFRMPLTDFNFEPDFLPAALNHVEVACVAFKDDPFPQETHADAYYYVDGVVGVSATGECVYLK